MNKLIDLVAGNQEFLDRHNESHPWRCRTKVSYPTPEILRMKIPNLSHISAPILKEREWGFRTLNDMQAFKTLFVTVDNEE